MSMLSTPWKPRWMAIWLPRLPTDRLPRASSTPPEHFPLALYAKSGNAFALTACDGSAARVGLHVGMALADARAMCPHLIAHHADPDADARQLDQIAAWCERFTPIVVLDPPHGLFLDISGCAHLHGGQGAMLKSLEAGLARQGFTAHGAIAPTPGAAWALARFATNAIMDESGLREALAPLPIAALRLEPPAMALLKRLGLKTVGQILDAPRAPFSARAGQGAMLRLDQALGRASEALCPRRPPPPVFALRRLVEPIVSLDAILIVVERLCADLSAKLDAGGHGARRLCLSLFGVDGAPRTLELRLTQPERSAKPMLRLLRERLSVTAETLNAEFGFEALRLDAAETAPIALRETDLAPAATLRDAEAEARLCDRLAARLGQGCVGALSVRASHAPERTNAWAGKDDVSCAIDTPLDGVMRRPLTLFTPAQPIEAIASVPDGPPVQFRWRRVLRKIVRAEGPERITPNWLSAPHGHTRDYYRVEDERGRRYWLYREGFYDEEKPPRWFVHGLFA